MRERGRGKNNGPVLRPLSPSLSLSFFQRAATLATDGPS
jgi:hypothetical protein